MQVPFIDLERSNGPLRGPIREALADVVASGQFGLGPQAEELERRLAELCGVRHALGVASGADAILLSLWALGVGPGDYVLTSPFTFHATATTIARLAARPAFCDIDPDTFNVNGELVREGIERLFKRSPEARDRLKVVMPVHLFGQMAPMDEIVEATSEAGAQVVEDACQAVAAVWQGRAAGSFGRTGCFSFYATKNLSAMGDAGMITTDDDELPELLHRLRDPRAARTDIHEEMGANSRMDAFQAAVLLVKLDHLTMWTHMRRVSATLYRERLAAVDEVTLPVELEPHPIRHDEEPSVAFTHVYHQFVIRARRRDELQAFLNDEGVSTGIFYAVPLHLHKCFAYLEYEQGDFPNAERAAREVLALPVFPGITRGEIEYVCDRIRAFYAR